MTSPSDILQAQLTNSPQRLQLKLERAMSYSINVAFVDASGAPCDLTDHQMIFQAAYPRQRGGGVAVTSIIVYTNASQGLGRFDFQTTDLDIPSGQYDVGITLLTPEGYDTLIGKGLLEILPNTGNPWLDEFDSVVPETTLTFQIMSSDTIKMVVNSLPAPDFLATAHVLPAGATPTVEVEGTWPLQTLEFGIPTGPQGIPGPQGPPGAGTVPAGPAGGVLGGTYPNPTFAADMATQSELDAAVAAFTAALAGKQDTSAKNAAGGYAGLDGSSKLTLSQIPALGITNTTGLQAALDAKSSKPQTWVSTTAYALDATVSYAGVIYKATSASTGQCPPFNQDVWEAVTGKGFQDWSFKDADCNGDPAGAVTSNWSSFWKTGTVTMAYTRTAGEFETGLSSLKFTMGATSTQRTYCLEENLVVPGEVVIMKVRAKVLSGSGASMTAAMLQNDEGSRVEPGATGLQQATATEGSQVLTTSWAWYTFTCTALSKPRANMNFIITQDATVGGSVVAVDRVRIWRKDAPGNGDINGVATLDALGRVTSAQLRGMERWDSGHTYLGEDVVGYAGGMFESRGLVPVNDSPLLKGGSWDIVTMSDAVGGGWHYNDPNFDCDTLGMSWQTFWGSGTHVPSLTQTAGEFETGYQALKSVLTGAASQMIYPRTENSIRPGQWVEVRVRAKLLTGAPTLGFGMHQSKVGQPEPFGPDVDFGTVVGNNQALNAAWTTYTAYIQASAAGKPRASVFVTVDATANASAVIDWIEIRKLKFDPTWHSVGAAGEPAFQNDWSNLGSYQTVRFRKNEMGEVRIVGVATSTSGALSTIFTLPAGYRPGGSMDLYNVQGNVTLTSGAASTGTAHTHPIPINSTALRVKIDAAGVVSLDGVAARAATHLAFSGLTFLAEN